MCVCVCVCVRARVHTTRVQSQGGVRGSPGAFRGPVLRAGGPSPAVLSWEMFTCRLRPECRHWGRKVGQCSRRSLSPRETRSSHSWKGSSGTQLPGVCCAPANIRVRLHRIEQAEEEGFSDTKMSRQAGMTKHLSKSWRLAQDKTDRKNKYPVKES